jgi:ABC-type Zn2+ transport system substrate-binding protein/surface adhesin
MKKKIQLLGMSIIYLSLSLTSCQTQEKKENKEENKKENTEEKEVNEEEEHHHHDETETIQLNNGAKWKVEEKMLMYIRSVETSLNNFKTPSAENFKTLSSVIAENLTALTSNCTMEGQAHDELHKWLVPFLELSEKFENETDLENMKTIFEEMKNSFVTFNTYFE